MVRNNLGNGQEWTESCLLDSMKTPWLYSK